MALQELVTYSNVERVSSHTHGLTISLDTSVLVRFFTLICSSLLLTNLNTVDTQEKPYLCEVCNKRFGRR